MLWIQAGLFFLYKAIFWGEREGVDQVFLPQGALPVFCFEKVEALDSKKRNNT